jgi:hypothetical protein
MEFCKNEANKPRSLELPAFVEKPARVKLVDQFTIQVQNCLQVTRRQRTVYAPDLQEPQAAIRCRPWTMQLRCGTW